MNGCRSGSISLISIPLVRHLGLATGDELLQRLVDGLVDRGRFVGGEHLGEPVGGALLDAPLTGVTPLLEARVVGGPAVPERGLVVAQRVLGAEEVLAGADLVEAVERELVVGEIDALAGTCAARRRSRRRR